MHHANTCNQTQFKRTHDTACGPNTIRAKDFAPDTEGSDDDTPGVDRDVAVVQNDTAHAQHAPTTAKDVHECCTRSRRHENSALRLYDNTAHSHETPNALKTPPPPAYTRKP